MREMKDSGIEWIGKIPKEWTLKKIKYIASERNENAKMKADDKYIGLENVTSGKNEVSFSETEYLPSIQSVCKVNDVMFSKLRPYLNKVIICPYNCFCTSEFIVYKEFKGDIRFLRYFMTCDGFINTVTASTYGTKMPRANPGFINNLYICYCEKKEQIEIANYLDSKCSEIDAITADIQKEITTLEDYKKSVITEAVTKGLNPNVEMKDSGIDWIGKIPKHWSIPKITHILDYTKLYSIGDGDHGSIKAEDYVDNGIPFIRVQNLGFATDLDLNNVVYISEKQNAKIANSTLYPNDILFAKTGATIGKVGIIPATLKKANTTSHVGKLTVSDKIVPKFIFYVLSSIIGYKQFWDIALMKSTRPELSIDEIKTLRVIVPSTKEEQQEIADYLDSKCSEIDAITADIQKEITVLEDYKKSIIYDTVSHGFTKNNTSEIHDGVWSNLPLGWKLVDIKYLFEIVKRIAGKEGYDILSVTQKGLRIKDITSNQGQLADDYSGYQLVYPTDYVMNHMDLLTGWVDCSKLFGVTSPDYRVFRLRNKADNSLAYYKYVMQCCYMNKIFYSLGQGVSNLGRWRLQTSAFNNFKVPVPPKSEQDEIADYLDSKCSEIDATIADKQKQLETLSDYKKSLIYEHVTGKKEVPCHE